MAALPGIPKIRRKPRQAAGRPTGEGEHSKKRTHQPRGNGFLNHRFLPFWGYEALEARQTEESFFFSVTNICELYQLDRPDISGLSFPQNISYSFKQIKRGIQKQDKHLDCLIVEGDMNLVSLATVKTFDTGMTLYYIPVRPLIGIIKTCERQPLANLFLSIFSYLYQVVKVSFYREDKSYLRYEYETITEWFSDGDADVEDDYRKEQMEEMRELEVSGDELLRYIRDSHYLEKFRQNISDFVFADPSNLRVSRLAKKCLKLWSDYPERTLADSVLSDRLLSDRTDSISVDQYVSFYWTGFGSLSDILIDMIDNQFQETAHITEPTVIQIFNEPQKLIDNPFDFETRLFSILNELSELLNEYDCEKY